MALWCWNERVDCLGRFSLMLVAGKMLVAVGVSLWNGDSVGIFGFLDFFDFLELMEDF